jgi:hypothetical protein
MPPLLAALLMMEFDCDLRIIEAIDLGVEWRRYTLDCIDGCTRWWYAGCLGREDTPADLVGTYIWPYHHNRRY